ncbi:MAG: enoyl-CoA hydratase/isomerase family protein [Hyphomonadaceae bacterium]|nr:enoyl-CoA hydratase/isomerase family protein [Hyphomonadaceae bacterium]
MDLGTTKMMARKEDGVGWMIFNQPEKHNAMSYAMWLAVPKIMAGFEADPEVRVIVLAGAGEKAFVSGADISEFEARRSAEASIKVYDAAAEAAQRALIEAAKPTIAMIRGICIGGGVAIALNTDVRICSANAVFAVPAAKLGLGYKYAGIKRLVDIVGPAFAKEIFFSAGKFTSEDARIMGLVNRVVPEPELESTVRTFAAAISANAPLTIKAAKMAIDAAVEDPERRRLAEIDAAIKACFASADYIEGRRAFMAKRKPKFKGR